MGRCVTEKEGIALTDAIAQANANSIHGGVTNPEDAWVSGAHLQDEMGWKLANRSHLTKVAVQRAAPMARPSVAMMAHSEARPNMTRCGMTPKMNARSEQHEPI
jgi:hypothetical protein